MARGSAAWTFGTMPASLTRNQTPPAPYTLFDDGEPARARRSAAEGRVGFHVTRTFAIEGAFVFSRPSLETAVSGDAEDVPAITATEQLSQFLVDVSAVLHLTGARLGRAVPFVLGGAGYLRELHEGDVLAETGHTWHVGGGLKMPLVVRRGFVRALGLRLDARVYFRQGGADLDEHEPTRAAAAGGASLFLEF